MLSVVSNVRSGPRSSNGPDSDDSAERISDTLTIDANGHVTVYSGKVELGTGVRTALAQVVADALDVPFDRVMMVMGDTRVSPDEGGTTGSKTLQHSAPRLARIGAAARAVLIQRASAVLAVPVEQLRTRSGFVVVTEEQERSVTYGDLAAEPLCQRLSDVALAPPLPRSAIVGQSTPRVDLPNKLTGGEAFIHDLRLDGMLHGRVIRPHVRTLRGAAGASLQHVDDTAVREMPGLVAIVRHGSFVGVVTEREEQAIRAAEALRVTWSAPEPLPNHQQLHLGMKQSPQVTVEVASAGDVDAAFEHVAQMREATYAFPWQAHASLGPSCAVADVRPDGATVYSSSQHVFALRASLAPLLGMDVEQIHVIHREGAGCYGHNGADDVSADAALLSQAVGRPVRVQWGRADEFAWEPKGPAMLSHLRAGLSGTGQIMSWEYDVWTPTHTTRPGGEPDRLFAGQLVEPLAAPMPVRHAGGDRNSIPNYDFPHQRVTAHWLTSPPLRPGSLRSLGGMANTTAIESFMDELAVAAGDDPVAFRLRHLTDPRAIEVIIRAAELANWQSRSSDSFAGSKRVNVGGDIARGHGIAFARYESKYAYVAVVAEVSVELSSGVVRVTRIMVAHDCGLIVNPDGLTNQIEGNIIQGISRALKEEVTFDQSQVTSLNWMTYPILTFEEVPAIEVALIDRPDEPPWGAGEPAICPLAAAIGNAIFDATGVRLRSVPFTPDRVLAALMG